MQLESCNWIHALMQLNVLLHISCIGCSIFTAEYTGTILGQTYELTFTNLRELLRIHEPSGAPGSADKGLFLERRGRHTHKHTHTNSW